MTKLLPNLEKVAYQAYTIKHGIESIKIQVPLEHAKAFEKEFNKAVAAGESKDELLRIMNKHGGNIRLKHRDAK